MTLVEQIADQLGIDEEGARSALGTFAGQIAHLVDTGGSLEVPGLGKFSENDGVLVFKPTEELAEAVNHRFAGLETLTVTRSEGELTTIVKEESAEATASEAESENESFSTGSVVTESEVDSVESEAADGEGPADVFAELDVTDSELEHSDEVDTFDVGDTVAEPEVVDSDTATVDEQSFVPKSAIEPLEKTSMTKDRSSKKPEVRTTGASPARLFVPLLGVLAIVVALLWLVNRAGNDSAPVATTDVGAAATDQSSGSQQQSSDVSSDDPASVDPVDQSATTQPVVPLWSPGQIDRNVGAYTIIVSSEETRPEAEAIARSIATRLNQITDVFVSTVNNTTRYRVGVGQYSSANSAARELSQLTTELPDGSWVLRIQPSM